MRVSWFCAGGRADQLERVVAGCGGGGVIAVAPDRFSVRRASGSRLLSSASPSVAGRRWVSVSPVDPSTGASLDFTGVDCPSRALCVATDGSGNVLTSTDPAGGASTWTPAHIDANNGYECEHYGQTGCQVQLGAVSCASATSCTALGGDCDGEV